MRQMGSSSSSRISMVVPHSSSSAVPPTARSTRGWPRAASPCRSRLMSTSAMSSDCSDRLPQLGEGSSQAASATIQASRSGSSATSSHAGQRGRRLG